MTRTLSTKLLLLLFLLLCLAVCSCRERTPAGEPDTAGGTEAPGTAVAEPLEVVRNGKTDFQIVCARSASLSVTRAAERLSEWFAAGGVTVPVMKDGGNANQNVPTDTYEILIGSTNRAESLAVPASELPERGYLCRVSGRRVVILATDDRLLEVAVSELFGQYQAALDEGTLILDGNFSRTVDCTDEREGWLLHGIPDYTGGQLSRKLYDCGFGLYDYSENEEANSVMQIAHHTTVQEYQAYLKRLEDAGYCKTFENSIGDNRYAAYRLCNLRLYVYYTAADSAARIVWDRNSTVDPDAFSYTATADETAESVFYAYAIWQGTDGLYSNNCGQLEVIKLADNSLFVIDGAIADQFDAAEREGFVRFAREITGTPEGEKVRIACWFFTHDHYDHRSGLAKVLASAEYASAFELERMAFNYLNATLSRGDSMGLREMYNSLLALYPDCEMLKLHTGMKLQLANLQLEVLYTHEDAVIASTGASRIDKKDLTNDASTVLRLTMEEVSCLILGDLDQLGESILIENIPAEYLQVDLIQVAHHTWNQILRLYDIARAEYAVFTQSEGGSNRTLGINARAVLRKIQQYAKPEHCYFSSVETSGLLFRNGTVTLKETFPLCYNSFDFPWKYVYEGVDMSTVKDYKDEEP